MGDRRRRRATVMSSRTPSVSLALISALVAAAVAMMISRYSVSDICGWYLTDRGSSSQSYAPTPAKVENFGDRAGAASEDVVEDRQVKHKVEENKEDKEGKEGKEDDKEESAACQLSGTVPHYGCSYAAVESMNLNSMRSILSELVQTPFFRYFKTVRW